MKRNLIGIPLALLLCCSAKADDVTVGTGNELIKSCNQQNYTSQNGSWGFCVGYVSGVSAEYVTIASSLMPKSNTPIPEDVKSVLTVLSHGMMQLFCMPSNSTREQSALVVSKYLADNPDKLNLVASDLIVDALAKAWPCVPPKK